MANTSDILLELTFSIKSNLNEEHLLNKTLIFYVKKLNCECAIIIPDKQIETDQNYISYPKAFRENENYNKIKKLLVENQSKKFPDNLAPHINQVKSHYVYAYKLSSYGRFIIIKSKPLKESFLYDLIPVFQFYGDTLNNAFKREYQDKIEKQLIEERQLLRTIVNNIPVRISFKDRNGKIKFANQKEIDFLGLNTEKEVVGKNESDFYSKKAYKKIKAEDRLVLDHKDEILNKEVLDNQNKSYLVSKLPLIVKSNYVEGIISLALDVTKNREKEDNLKFFINIMDQSSDAIFLTNENGTIDYCNKFAQKIVGIVPKNKKNNINFQDFDLKFEKDKPKVWKTLLEQLEEVDNLNYTTQFKNLITKETTPLEIKTKLITVNKQRHIISIGRDISEIIKSEKAIEDELKFQNLLLKISSTYINTNITSVERTIQQSLQEIGEFVRADRSYIFDYDHHLKTCSNTFEWCAEGISPEIDNLQNVSTHNSKEWLDKHEKGEDFLVKRVEDLPDEGELSLKDILSSQGIKSLITLPMLDDGKLVGFVGFDSVREYKYYSDREKKLLKLYADLLVNIEKRKRYAFEIKEQEERFQSLINSVDLNLIEVDENFNIIFINENFIQLYQYSSDELIGRNALKVLLSKSDEETLYHQLIQMNINQTMNSELVTYTKSGEQKTIYISIGLKLDEKQKVIGYIGAFLDITQEKQLEADLKLAKEKAEAASMEKERFLANMSHEMRTPLNIISGALSEVSKTENSEEKEFLLEQTKNASEHLLGLVNNVLDMAKINANEMNLKKDQFDLESVCKNAFSIVSNLAKEKNLSFQINYNISLVQYLIGDATKLSQVLINLLNNAVKYTEKGGVTFNVEKLKENKNQISLGFVITDTGIGMSKEFLNQLFKEFSTEQPQQQSTGLGMTISKKIINLMNGDIHIESKKNKGTKVSFTLQFEKFSNNKNPISEKESPHLSKGMSYKVLIVEDNKMNTLIVRKMLQRYHFETHEAKNGQEAIDFLSLNEVDLILMDIQMPVMGGIECTDFIRKELQLDLPIIALTANVFKGDLESFLRHGMNDYLIKPFKEEVLVKKCLEYLDQNQNQAKHKKEQLLETNIDLSYIKELANGDSTFELELIATFQSILDQSIKEFKEIIEKEDYKKAKHICHKIKPSLIDFKLTEFETHISNILANKNNKELKKLCQIMYLSLEQLKYKVNQLMSKN